jgi:hypothetical protein
MNWLTQRGNAYTIEPLGYCAKCNPYVPAILLENLEPASIARAVELLGGWTPDDDLDMP